MSMEGTTSGWPSHGESAPSESEAAAQAAALQGFIAANFKRFVHGDSAAWAAYKTRGLTPTHNLRILFDESQDEYWPNGVPNPNHHSSRPYGHIFDRLQVEHPELYAKAVEASGTFGARSEQFWGDVAAGVSTRLLAPVVDKVEWQLDEVMSEVFTVIAPQMAAEGYDPLDACL